MKSRHSFDPRQFGTFDDLRKSARSTHDQILLVACCDHGTAPCNLSIADPGCLTVVQNLAASIPRAGQTFGLTTLASIEYAVTLKGVRQIVVCGHRNCGVIARWLSSRGSAEVLPAAGDELQAAWTALSELTARISCDRPRDTIVREYVLRQVANLQSHEFIRRRLDDGQVQLHAWVVDDESARVQAYDPHSGEFRTLRGRREPVAQQCRR